MSSSGYPLLDISDNSESSDIQSDGEVQNAEVQNAANSQSQSKQSALKTKRAVPAKKHNLRERKQAQSSDGADEDEDEIVVKVSKK